MIFNSTSGIRRDGDGFRISVSSERPCRDTVFDSAKGAYRAVDVILAHSPEAIDGDWIGDGIPLRAEHFGELVGRALKPAIEDGKLVSREIVWSDSPLARQIRADVEKGVLRDLSIEADYRQADCEIAETAGGEGAVPTMTVRKWRPLAAAFVTVPADPSVGVNRKYSPMETDSTRKETAMETMTDKADKTGKTGKTDNGEIFALARKYNVPDETAQKWLAEGADLNAVRAEILRDFAKANATQTTEDDPLDEMQRAEHREYDIIKAIRSLLPNSKVDAGFEWEVSAECARRYGKTPKGIMVPLTVARAFTTAEGSGAAITPTIHSSTYYDILRAKLVLEKLGAHVMNVSGESVNIPKTASDSGPSVYWINGNGEAVGEGTIKTGQVTLNRKTAGTYVDISRALLNGSVPDAQSIVLNAIAENMARGIQLAILKGDGQNNKPAGVIPKLTAKTFATAGSPTWQEILAKFEGELSAGNMEVADCKWLCAPVTFALLRGASRDQGSGKFIATREAGSAYIADLPAEISSVLDSGEMILADWSKMIIGMHSGLDLTVSTEALATSGGVRCIALQDCSTNIVAPSDFAYTATANGYTPQAQGGND
jgi:HK97 family phage major capsid protein